MPRTPSGRTSKVVRVPSDVADVLAARAKAAGVSVGAYLSALLVVGDEPAAARAAPPAPPASSQATVHGGRRCSCKTPKMSSVVTNICTACGLVRR